MSVENFYTIDEALSIIDEEISAKKITRRDIFINALNKKIVLSAYFDTEVPMLRCHLHDYPAPERDNTEKSYLVRKKSHDQKIVEVDYSDEVFRLKGLLDLTMCGAERSQIDKYLLSYEFDTLDPEVKIGAILKRGNDYFELSEYELGVDEYLYGGNLKGKLMPSDPDNARMYVPASLNSVDQIVIKKFHLDELILKENTLFHPRYSPEEIVKRGKEAGKKDYQIAYDIDIQYSGDRKLKNVQLGALLPANPGAVIEELSAVKRGQRLRKEYKNKNLNKK